MKICTALIVLLMHFLCSCKKTKIEDQIKTHYLTIEFKSSKVNNKTTEVIDSKASYFPYGYKTTIYIFKSQTLWPYVGNSPIVATSYGGGDLIPEKGIMLPKGIYDIYSLSENSPFNCDLNIFEGTASGLVNRKDYLWAKSEGVLLLKNEVVNLSFKHIACRLLISVEADEDNTSILLNTFRMTLPCDVVNTLNLENGIISPSVSPGQLSTIEGNGNIREVLILPSLANLYFEFDAEVLTEGGTSVIRRFFGETDRQLIAGNSYELSVKIKSDMGLKIELRGYPPNTVDNQIIFKSTNN